MGISYQKKRQTPKPEAPGSNPGGDAILRKCEGHFSM